MGTDIHVALEKRTIDGKAWEYVSPPMQWYCYQSMGGCAAGDTVSEKPCCDKAQGHRGWGFNRNYSLFAILANVRNGYGFGGCDTGNGFEVIAKQRGIPNDLSPEM